MTDTIKGEPRVLATDAAHRAYRGDQQDHPDILG
jgi:hypothetical protein